jgi:hypothetical protein
MKIRCISISSTPIFFSLTLLTELNLLEVFLDHIVANMVIIAMTMPARPKDSAMVSLMETISKHVGKSRMEGLTHLEVLAGGSAE